MEGAQYKFGDKFTVTEALRSIKRSNGKPIILVESGQEVSLVSCSTEMAIVHYGNENFSTRLSNLNPIKEKPKSNDA